MAFICAAVRMSKKLLFSWPLVAAVTVSCVSIWAVIWLEWRVIWWFMAVVTSTCAERGSEVAMSLTSEGVRFSKPIWIEAAVAAESVRVLVRT